MMACRKVKYFTRLEAKMALARTHRSRSGNRQESRIYWCQACQALHLTSQK